MKKLLAVFFMCVGMFILVPTISNMPIRNQTLPYVSFPEWFGYFSLMIIGFGCIFAAMYLMESYGGRIKTLDDLTVGEIYQYDSGCNSRVADETELHLITLRDRRGRIFLCKLPLVGMSSSPFKVVVEEKTSEKRIEFTT
ncbi:MAG: hypothetical protein HY507_00335 [Candidatus Zambryskibacteria bacterium]|nr:hypothetical protein [Candidatus Zambryskibacteria bacterium]